MPFQTNNEPQKPETAEEKLVNVEKETPEEKKDPVVVPVNTDVDKSELGKGEPNPDIKIIEPPVATITPSFGTKEKEMGLRHGAGSTINKVKKGQHSVRIENLSRNDSKYYNFLVHCDTCGFEGRYEREVQAQVVQKNHIDANSRAA